MRTMPFTNREAADRYAAAAKKLGFGVCLGLYPDGAVDVYTWSIPA